MHTPRSAFEFNDTVNRVVALLIRFPEIHSIRSNPADASLTLSYAVGVRLDRAAIRDLRDFLRDHVGAMLELQAEVPAKMALTSEGDANVTFLHVRRDVATFTRQELALQIALIGTRFGSALVKSAPQEAGDDDPAERDELVEAALDSLRDPAQRKRLVGFREEKRVLVYFVHSGKGAKRRARS